MINDIYMDYIYMDYINYKLLKTFINCKRCFNKKKIK